MSGSEAVGARDDRKGRLYCEIGNARVSWQRVDGPQHAFLFSPQLVQQGNFGSDLVRLGDGHGRMKGWAKTRAAALANKRATPTAASKKLLGRRGAWLQAHPAASWQDDLA